MHLKAQAPQWEHGFQFVEVPLQCHLLWLKTYSDAGSRFMLHQGERDRERQMEEWESCVGLKVKSHVRGHQDYLEARKAARGEENTYNKSVSQGKEPFSKALHPRDQHLGQDDFCEMNCVYHTSCLHSPVTEWQFAFPCGIAVLRTLACRTPQCFTRTFMLFYILNIRYSFNFLRRQPSTTMCLSQSNGGSLRQVFTVNCLIKA